MAPDGAGRTGYKRFSLPAAAGGAVCRRLKPPRQPDGLAAARELPARLRFRPIPNEQPLIEPAVELLRAAHVGEGALCEHGRERAGGDVP